MNGAHDDRAGVHRDEQGGFLKTSDSTKVKLYAVNSASGNTNAIYLIPLREGGEVNGR